jgi:hypothetical protein
VARTDYAVCSGDQAGMEQNGAGPGIGADNRINGSLTPSATAAQNAYFGWPLSLRSSSNMSKYDGICFELSTIRLDDITDGASQTIMIGEKYLGANDYGSGGVGADNENEYVGFDNDTGRDTYIPPMQDRWGVDNAYAFGSAHPTAANFALCDGSTISINYSVDANTFRMLGTRAEGVPVDMSKLGSF